MFNLNDWIANRGVFDDIEIEGIELQIVSLSDELKRRLSNYETHTNLVDFISEFGLSHGRNRIADDNELSKDLKTIFALPEFNVDCSPSVKEQIAQAVCELSGLGDLLAEQQLKEEEAAEKAKVINGDDLEGKLETSLGELHDDEAAENNYN